MNQEPIKPDYNYILNQETPVQKSKGISGKSIIFFSSLLVLFVLGGILLFVETKPQEVSVNNRSSDQVAADFMQHMNDGRYDSDTASMLSKTLTKDSGLEELVIKRLQNGITFKTCARTDKKFSTKTTTDYVYKCELVNKKRVVLTLSVQKENNKPVIIGHQVVNDA